MLVDFSSLIYLSILSFFLIPGFYFSLYSSWINHLFASPPSSNMSKTFSANDVSSKGTGNNLYVIIDEDVYDLTKFQDEHPGGKKSMSSV